MPLRPTGADRRALLDALAAAAPDAFRYDDEAVDAARNQCSAINGTGVKRIDWLASLLPCRAGNPSASWHRP